MRSPSGWMAGRLRDPHLGQWRHVDRAGGLEGLQQIFQLGWIDRLPQKMSGELQALHRADHRAWRSNAGRAGGESADHCRVHWPAPIRVCWAHVRCRQSVTPMVRRVVGDTKIIKGDEAARLRGTIEPSGAVAIAGSGGWCKGWRTRMSAWCAWSPGPASRTSSGSPTRWRFVEVVDELRAMAAARAVGRTR